MRLKPLTHPCMQVRKQQDEVRRPGSAQALTVGMHACHQQAVVHHRRSYLHCNLGECDNIAGELAEAQATGAEAARERDELAASLAALEAEHANLGDAHTALQ